MKTIRKILGDRILIRRVEAVSAMKLRCRYSDCSEHHPIASNGEQVTCDLCRTYLGLARLDTAIIHAPNPDEREPAFEALVVGVGAKLSDDIKPGDTVILAAPPSQDRVGTRKVIWNGEPCELVSTLDVAAVRL